MGARVWLEEMALFRAARVLASGSRTSRDAVRTGKETYGEKWDGITREIRERK
jgi:hypothetical protein